MTDVIARARAVMEAAQPPALPLFQKSFGPWNPYWDWARRTSKAILLAVNALPTLLDVLEIASRMRGPLDPAAPRRLTIEEDIKIDEALAALRAALDGSGE